MGGAPCQKLSIPHFNFTRSTTRSVWCKKNFGFLVVVNTSSWAEFVARALSWPPRTTTTTSPKQTTTTWWPPRTTTTTSRGRPQRQAGGAATTNGGHKERRVDSKNTGPADDASEDTSFTGTEYSEYSFYDVVVDAVEDDDAGEPAEAAPAAEPSMVPAPTRQVKKTPKVIAKSVKTEKSFAVVRGTRL